MSRRIRITAIVVTSLAVLIVIALLLLTEVLRRTAIAHPEEQWGTRVTIGDLDLNVFTGRIAVTDLSVFKPEENALSLKIPKAEIKLSFLSLIGFGNYCRQESISVLTASPCREWSNPHSPCP